jgi:hypothetical protein
VQALRASGLSMVKAAIDVQIRSILTFFSDTEQSTLVLRKSIWEQKRLLESYGAHAATPLWQKLEAYQNIRNAFVHSDGLVAEVLTNPEQVLRAAMNLPTVTLKDNQVTLGIDVVSDYASAAKRTCLELMGAVSRLS